MPEKNYLAAFGGRSGEQVGDDILRYFSDLFSLEMPLGRMMKMMPGMVRYAMRGKEYRQDLVRFAPKMVPMIKQAVGMGDKDKR